MSKYTTEVRFICEHYAGLDESKGYDNVENIISKARKKIFDFQYPIFDDAYKPILETKILKHYYTREIGFETVGLWKLKLNALLNEIMPYYNKMYESELLEFNPFDDIHKTITHEGSDRGTKNTDADTTAGHNATVGYTGRKDIDGSSTTTFDGTVDYEGESDSWNLYSDTPQGGLNGIEAAYDGVSSNAYLTDARNIKEEEENTTTTSNTEHGTTATDVVDSNTTTTTETNTSASNVDEEHENSNEWVEVISGKQGTLSYSKMLEEFRNTFLNIDMMIIEELAGLFFMLW